MDLSLIRRKNTLYFDMMNELKPPLIDNNNDNPLMKNFKMKQQ